MTERSGLNIIRGAEVLGLRVALVAVRVAQFGDLDVPGYTNLDVVYHGIAARLKKAQGNTEEFAYHQRRQSDIRAIVKGQ
ncbi:hypothetical protein HYS93_04875 [Candidatus Daviesbacteria bacterium]|nr:hypothetical protein [Candidatus Daviesbacteria bacterium]